MSIRLDKPWIEFSKQSIDRVTGHLGVYQLANAGKEIIYIGIAGAKNAALLGVQILALSDPKLSRSLKKWRSVQTAKVIETPS